MHYLLPALRGAFEARNLNRVTQILNLLDEDNSETFLSDIPELLYDAFQASEEIATEFTNFVKTKDPKKLFYIIGEKNAFWLAINFNYTELAKEIFKFVEENYPNEINLKCLIPTSEDSFMDPLDLAVETSNVEIVQLILEKKASLARNHRFSYLSDTTHVRRKTPLHYALIAEHVEIVALLINHGANLFISDEKSITPFYLLTHRSFAIQIAIFARLDPEQKQKLIGIYKKQLDLSRYSANPILNKVYIRMAGLKSLENLIIAQHEYSDDMPLRPKVLLTQNVLDLMPRYQAKLARLNSQDKHPLDANNNNHSIVIDLSSEKRLPVDPENLDTLILDVRSTKKRIMRLPPGYPYRISAEALSAGVLIFTWVGFLAVLLFELHNETSFSKEYTKSKEYINYLSTFFSLALTNLFLGSLNAYLLFRISRLQGKISKQEYSELVENIRATITNQINFFIAATDDEELKDIYKNFLLALNNSLKPLTKNQHQRNIPPIFKELIDNLELLALEITDQPSIVSTEATLFARHDRKQITQGVPLDSENESSSENESDSSDSIDSSRDDQILTIPSSHSNDEPDDEESSDHEFGNEEEEIPLLRMGRKG